VRDAAGREDLGDPARLEDVSGIYSRPKKEAEMSEQEQFESEEKDDDVEAHKRRLADEPSEQEENKDDDDGDDVEAHRRR
jgi:hypothetical protein